MALNNLSIELRDAARWVKQRNERIAKEHEEQGEKILSLLRKYVSEKVIEALEMEPDLAYMNDKPERYQEPDITLEFEVDNVEGSLYPHDETGSRWTLSISGVGRDEYPIMYTYEVEGEDLQNELLGVIQEIKGSI